MTFIWTENFGEGPPKRMPEIPRMPNLQYRKLWHMWSYETTEHIAQYGIDIEKEILICLGHIPRMPQ